VTRIVRQDEVLLACTFTYTRGVGFGEACCLLCVLVHCSEEIVVPFGEACCLLCVLVHCSE